MTTTCRRLALAALALLAFPPGAASPARGGEAPRDGQAASTGQGAQAGQEARGGRADALREFVAARGGATGEIAAFLAAPGDATRRLKTPTHWLAARKVARPAAEKTPRVAQALAQAATMQARRQLLHELFAGLPEVPFQDRAMAEETYLQAMAEDLPGFRLPGMEFVAGGGDGVFWAAAAIRPAEATAAIQANLAKPEFARLYCRNGFVRAKNAFQMRDYPHALRLLREAHQSGYANAAAYVLLARTFTRLGQNADAQIIAKETLSRFAEGLSAESAEELGDLLMELKCEPEAQKAYEIAIARTP